VEGGGGGKGCCSCSKCTKEEKLGHVYDGKNVDDIFTWENILITDIYKV